MSSLLVGGMGSGSLLVLGLGGSGGVVPPVITGDGDKMINGTVTVIPSLTYAVLRIDSFSPSTRIDTMSARLEADSLSLKIV